jgi:superfamily II DNA or RNA helicase
MEKLPPVIAEKDWADTYGWAVVRAGKALADAKSVTEISWEFPSLTGLVTVADSEFRPVLNLRSAAFTENKCSCDDGRRGKFCAHALALYFTYFAARFAAIEAAVAAKKAAAALPPQTKAVSGAARRGEPTSLAQAVGRIGNGRIAIIPATPQKPSPGVKPPEPASDAIPLEPKSLVLAPERGLPLSFRVLLPPGPKLAEAAAGDSVMVKLEALMPDGKPAAPEFLDRGRAYKLHPDDARLAALVEHWCGGRLHGLLRLTRERLLALICVGVGRPVFAFADTPRAALKWDGDKLVGVSELLVAPVAPSVSAMVAAGTVVGAPHRGARHEAPAPKIPAPRTGSARTLHVEGNLNWLAVKLPSRESEHYAGAREMIAGAGFSNDASAGVWRLTDRHKVLAFIAANLEKLEYEYGADFSDRFTEVVATQVKVATASCSATADGEGFEIELKLDTHGADDAAVNRALAQNRPYLESGDGSVVLLPPGTVKVIDEARRRISGDPDSKHAGPVFRKKLSVAELADAEAALDPLAVPFDPPETWKKRAGALRNLSRLELAPCDPALRDRLRIYQQIGASWLWHLHKNSLGGVLADEMGLGKTVQALSYIDGVLRTGGPSARILVVCPAALTENWFREADRFLPGRPVLKHHGANRGDHAEVFSGYDIVVTSYATLARDSELFAEIEWAAVVADEAQHIKNRRSQNARALHRVRAKGRAVLTGTPIENSLDDLRSIFDFLMPGYLTKVPPGLSREDRLWHDNRLREQCAPYILRRTKKIVAPELPDKIHQTVFCEMEGDQRKLYDKWLDETRAEIFNLEVGGASESRVRHAAFRQLLRLRQICADPRLVCDEAVEDDSAKLRALREILDEAVDGEHRVLVFSQFVEVLKLIRTSLERDGISYCYIDGSTRDRQKEVDRFNGNADIPVFLISLKAGGVGLNLTGADTVVHFDPWWNPAAEAQATDRAHRIGQTRTVTSIRLIAAGSVEERVLAIQETKAKLLAELLEAGDEANSSVSVGDIKDLLGLNKE